jgi:membrane protein
MDFMNALGSFFGITSCAGILGLFLTLYSTMHIDTIRYTLVDYDKKVEYSFKRLIINLVGVIFLVVCLFLTSIIPNNNNVDTIYFIIFGVAFFLLSMVFIWLLSSKIWHLRNQFLKIRREDIIFPVIMICILLYYSFLSFSYICEIMVIISRLFLGSGIIVFVVILCYGMYKKSDKEKIISYYYAYEGKDDRSCDKIYIYENIDGVLVCRYKDCFKVTEEESNKLSKELSECEKHIENRVWDENNKKSIIEKINEVRKYNRHGYIELSDKCVIDFVSKIMEFNDTTPNNESILEELGKYFMEVKEFASIKLIDISSIKDGKIYPNLDNIEKFNNLL